MTLFAHGSMPHVNTPPMWPVGMVVAVMPGWRWFVVRSADPIRSWVLRIGRLSFYIWLD